MRREGGLTTAVPRDAPPAALRFPCPGCGAQLSYDPARRGLRCPFCGAERGIDGGGTVVERDLDDALRKAGAERSAGARDARRFDCCACGASVEVHPEEKSVRCAWCGSLEVVEEPRDPNRIPPDSVLPFAVDRAQAESLFRRWLRSLWFRPNALKTRSAIDEIRGVMVPFWTFDARAASSWTAEAGYHYYVPVRVGKTTVMQQRTRWEPAAGSREDLHDDWLVCASRGLDGGLLRAVEPFDLAGLAPYRDEYLAGFGAESYAVDAAEAWGRAQAGILAEQERRCGRDVPGDTHRGLAVRTTLSGRTYKHALLPVWVAAYRFRGKAFRFLVNGQTGEVQGEAPLSWAKILLAVLLVLAVGGIAILVATR